MRDPVGQWINGINSPPKLWAVDKISSWFEDWILRR